MITKAGENLMTQPINIQLIKLILNIIFTAMRYGYDKEIPQVTPLLYYGTTRRSNLSENLLRQ